MLRVAVGCAFALAQGLLGQEYEWVAVPGATGGPYRDAALVQDVVGGDVFAFGGTDSWMPLCPLIGGAGAWRYSAGNWAYQASFGPVARSKHALAVDAQRRRVVLFGGHNANGQDLQDTWEWDGSQWIPFPFVAPPAARRSHLMVYDSLRSRVMLHGGVVAGAPVGDTWDWTGASWVALSTAGPTGGQSIAQHAASGELLMVGSGMTWTWSGQSWVSAGNAPDCLAVLWDEARQEVMLVQDPLTYFGRSVWTWNSANRTWQSVAMRLGGGVPQGVRSVVFDRSTGKIAVRGEDIGSCGGFYYPMFLLQQYVPPRVVAAASSTGAGCGAPPLTLAQDAVRRPIIGASAVLDVSNAPLAFAYLAIGTGTDTLNTYTLPLSLGSLGFTGCVLRQNMDYEGAYPTVATGATSTRATIPIPNDPVLLRQSIHFQAWAFAPGANPAGITVSNMISWFIGEV
jgi:hypothetical protein